MTKGNIKGLDGSELEVYFPTKSEQLDLNNLNELDVNENSAGGGAHEEVMKKKCCGGGCHSKKKAEFPTTLSWNTPKELIKDFIKKAKEANKEVNPPAGIHEDLKFVDAYDYPLDKAFQYGYNVDVDPLNELFKLASKNPPQNKVKIDDTIESDLLKIEDLRLGRLYRVAGMNLIGRFVAQITIVITKDGEAQQKTLLQIKHHGIILYVEESSLVLASKGEVNNYLGYV